MIVFFGFFFFEWLLTSNWVQPSSVLQPSETWVSDVLAYCPNVTDCYTSPVPSQMCCDFTDIFFFLIFFFFFSPLFDPLPRIQHLLDNFFLGDKRKIKHNPVFRSQIQWNIT